MNRESRMNWEDGRLFLAVARHGQMLAAARRLGTTQATLSRRVRALEQALGTTLLLRRPHGSSLTPAGEALALVLERMESELVAATDLYVGQDHHVSGKVRISLPDGFGAAFLAPRLGRLLDRHPDLLLELVPPQATLGRGGADLMVRVGRPRDGADRARRLTRYSLGLYATPGYLATRPPVTRAEDLAGHRLIGFVEDMTASPDLDYCAEFYGTTPPRLGIASAAAQVAAVEGGAGIGVLHDYIAAGRPGIVPVLPALRTHREYWLVLDAARARVARVRTVADFLVAEVEAARVSFDQVAA